MDRLELIISLLFTTLGVVLVIFFTYWATKWLARKYKGMSNGKHIKVLERVALSQDKCLVLVGINEKVYFLGISSSNIETIAVMNKDELPQEEAEPEKTEFATVLKELMQNQLPFYRNNKK